MTEQNTPAESTDQPSAQATAAPTTPQATDTAQAPAAVKPKRTASPGTPPDGHWWWGTGRRKTAVARVRIRPGKGVFEINKRAHDEFFTEPRDRNDIIGVLKATGTEGAVDVHVNVHGGGYTGQAGAIVLGLARALRRYDESLDAVLRDHGFLSRDPRKVERKKYGQPGARKRFQFSKR
jgi:small subunit ribosomal protein S9